MSLKNNLLIVSFIGLITLTALGSAIFFMRWIYMSAERFKDLSGSELAILALLLISGGLLGFRYLFLKHRR